MKIISIVFYFFLLSNSTYAQIDYSYFKQTWCKCMPDSGTVETDTLTYRIKSEACNTKRYSEKHVYTEEQEYSFREKSRVQVYMSSGNAPREGYVGETSMEVFYKTNAVGDTVGVDSMYYKINPGIRISGCSIIDINYQLNKSKNIWKLFYGKEVEEYEILFLSSKMMLMRKVN